MEEKYIWWGFTAMAAIVTYLLKVLHIDLKKDITELKEDVSKIKIEQAGMDKRQDTIEKSIEDEVRHIRELMEIKLKAIADNIELLVKNSK